MKAVHKAVYTCEEATQLVVQSVDSKLSILQRLRLWLHLMMCRACRRFKVQNGWIDQQIQKFADFDGPQLKEEAKKRMEVALKSEINK